MKVWSQHAFRFAKKEILTAVIIYTVTENKEGGWVNQNSSFKSSQDDGDHCAAAAQKARLGNNNLANRFRSRYARNKRVEATVARCC